MKHIMLDLETLSSANNAAIVSIGACAFTLNGIGDMFCAPVNPASSQELGLNIDADTVSWWMAQSQTAREAAFPPNAEGLKHVLCAFHTWARDLGNDIDEICVWGNGATFDNVVLRNAYKAAHLKPFWSYRYDRCYRTMRNALRTAGDEVPFEGEAHNALDDAIHQAAQLIHCIKAHGMSLE